MVIEGKSSQLVMTYKQGFSQLSDKLAFDLHQT